MSIVTGTTGEVGSPLVEDPRTRLITMTGSITAGQAIYAAQSCSWQPRCLELGGKAPFIVLEDADVDRAVAAAVVARYANNGGQFCICNESVLVHEKILDEFTRGRRQGYSWSTPFMD